jgi:hypothetical protein
LGSGPLLGIIVAAKLGLTHDPNPNPIAFGILAGLTFWPVATQTEVSGFECLTRILRIRFFETGTRLKSVR